jgi:hypothetical protein
MKKKVIYGIAVMGLGTLSMINVGLNSQNNSSNVRLENLEALSIEVKPCPTFGSTYNNGKCNRGPTEVHWHCDPTPSDYDCYR